MVDTQVVGTCALRRESSSLSIRTNYISIDMNKCPECKFELAKMNCICHNRELVMELPSSAFPVGCAGCNGIVYGLADEDCRQVRLPNKS